MTDDETCAYGSCPNPAEAVVHDDSLDVLIDCCADHADYLTGKYPEMEVVEDDA